MKYLSRLDRLLFRYPASHTSFDMFNISKTMQLEKIISNRSKATTRTYEIYGSIFCPGKMIPPEIVEICYRRTL